MVIWERWKWILIIGAVLLVLVPGVIVWGHKGFNVGHVNDNYLVEFKMRDGNDYYEVRYYPEAYETVLVKNGERVELLSKLPRNPSSFLILPDVMDAYDLVGDRQPVYALTWEASLEESAMYLKYLEKKGFKVLREVYTPNFIEKIGILNEKRQRIIIFRNIIMVGELKDGAVLPDISSYLINYRR